LPLRGRDLVDLVDYSRLRGLLQRQQIIYKIHKISRAKRAGEKKINKKNNNYG